MVGSCGDRRWFVVCANIVEKGRHRRKWHRGSAEFVSSLDKGLREGAHLIEEIHEPSQLRSLEACQILVLFVALNQGTEATREVERRRIQRVEAM